MYKWGGRCSNVNFSALHKCYVVKKICPLSISLSQTWAPVSVDSGYTYHCNCRERTGPLTLTPCSQPYLDTAVAPACHFTPNAIHSFPNTQINTACSFGVFALIIFPQPPLQLKRDSERSQLSRDFRQSYKQQHTLSVFKERLTYIFSY